METKRKSGSNKVKTIQCSNWNAGTVLHLSEEESWMETKRELSHTTWQCAGKEHSSVEKNSTAT